MNIHVHIERLILGGLPIERSQSPHVQAAVEAELVRLLDAGSLSPNLSSGCALQSVPGGTIQLRNESNPIDLGQQIARAMYGGIGR